MDKPYIVTKHLNISLFYTYGFSIMYTPHWSLYILIGFIGINIIKKE